MLVKEKITLKGVLIIFFLWGADQNNHYKLDRVRPSFSTKNIEKFKRIKI
jgi:hypothetical protein